MLSELVALKEWNKLHGENEHYLTRKPIVWEQAKSIVDLETYKPKEIFVIGVSTGSGNVESWSFDNDQIREKFCENLARDTGHSVYVISGEILGKYDVEIPVKFTKV